MTQLPRKCSKIENMTRWWWTMNKSYSALLAMTMTLLKQWLQPWNMCSTISSSIIWKQFQCSQSRRMMKMSILLNGNLEIRNKLRQLIQLMKQLFWMFLLRLRRRRKVIRVIISNFNEISKGINKVFNFEKMSQKRKN